jgi:hypothetical protein
MPVYSGFCTDAETSYWVRGFLAAWFELAACCGAFEWTLSQIFPLL